MEFNNESLKKLREGIQKALQPVEETEHISVELGRITYNSSQCELKLTIYRKDEDMDGQKAEFEFMAPNYGFKPEDYMRKFIYDGKMYQFYGFNNRARLNCCLFIQIDSQAKYHCSASTMKKMLENSVTE